VSPILTDEERALLLARPKKKRVVRPAKPAYWDGEKLPSGRQQFSEGPIPDRALALIATATQDMGDPSKSCAPTLIARMAAELITARARIKELESQRG
jgi:hypothetical protein